MRQELPTPAKLGDAADVARVIISIRVDSNDLAAWKAAAKGAGIELSEFIRRRVNGTTTTTIEAPPPPVVKPAKPKKARRS